MVLCDTVGEQRRCTILSIWIKCFIVYSIVPEMYSISQNQLRVRYYELDTFHLIYLRCILEKYNPSLEAHAKSSNTCQYERFLLLIDWRHTNISLQCTGIAASSSELNLSSRCSIRFPWKILWFTLNLIPWMISTLDRQTELFEVFLINEFTYEFLKK
jgi:hypothetical protein